MMIIFRAIPGAGKTTCTQALTTSTGAELLAPTTPWTELQTLRGRLRGRRIHAHATDDYFTTPEGVYAFDPARLSVAHGWCLRRVIDDVRLSHATPGEHAVIVHNTNCTIAEVAPYAQLASAYQQELHVLTMLVDPLTAWRRNTHGVPLTNLIKQDLLLRQSILEWPPWWPQKVFAL